MRTEEFKRRLKPLLPLGRQWAVKGRIAYESPVGRVLCGLHFEGSDTGGIYIWRLTMPLFDGESDVVSLSHSRRTEGGLILKGDDRGFEVAVGRALQPFGSEEEQIERLAGLAFDRTTARIIGFAEVLLDQPSRARKALEVASLPTPKDTRPFVLEHQRGARLVLGLLESGGLPAARAQLNEWTVRNKTKLGLT